MLLSTLAVYLPFWFEDISVIVRHWDGPLYLYIAKTFYVVPPDHPFASALPATYYAAEFPLYPILIRIMTWFTLGNYPSAMILATLISSMAATCLFYQLLKEWRLVKSPLWTAVLFCFVPARWLLSHSIGSSEPLFFCLIFAVFLAHRRQKHLWTFVCLSLAAICRPPGVLLVGTVGIFYLMERRWKLFFLLPITLLSLIGLFAYHYVVLGDFLASFHVHSTMGFVSSATNQSSVNPYPLAIYRFYAARPNFHSTEVYLLLYVLSLIGVLALWKQKQLFIFSLIYFVFVCFLFNYDLSRFLLPIMPFTILIAFDEIFSRRSFRIVVFPFYVYLAYTFVKGFLPLAVCRPETFQLLLYQIKTLP